MEERYFFCFYYYDATGLYNKGKKENDVKITPV